MEDQETELEMLKREISRKDESLARQRLQIEDLVTRNTELTKERDDAVSHIKDVLEQRNLLRVKAASYHDKNERLKKELCRQAIKVSDLEYEVEQLKKAIDRKQTELVNWSERVRKISRKNYQRDNEIAELKTERSEIAHHCCEQGEAIRTLKKDNRELEEQLKDASEIIRELTAVKNDEIDRLKADLSHAMDHLEKYQGREQFMEVLRDMRSNYDRCLAYMGGQEQIIDEKDKTIDELRQRLEAKALDELKHKIMGTGRKDHD